MTHEEQLLTDERNAWEEQANKHEAEVNRLREQLTRHAPSQLASQSAMIPPDPFSGEHDEEEGEEDDTQGTLQAVNAEIEGKFKTSLEHAKEILSGTILPACNQVRKSGQATTIMIAGEAFKVTLFAAKAILEDPVFMLGLSLALAIGEVRIQGGEFVWDKGTYAWNTIWDNSLTRLIHVDWLKVDPVPFSLWGELMKRTEGIFKSTVGAKIASALAHNALKCIILTRKAVYGKLQVDDEKGAEELLSIREAIQDMAGGKLALEHGPQIIQIAHHYGIHPALMGPVQQPYGPMPQPQYALEQGQPASSSSMAPFGLNSVRLPPATIEHPNPAQRWTKQARAQHTQAVLDKQKAHQTLQQMRHAAEYQEELGELPTNPHSKAKGKRAVNMAHLDEAATDMSGRGRIGVPSPVLPYNDVSNDHFLNKSPFQ